MFKYIYLTLALLSFLGATAPAYAGHWCSGGNRSYCNNHNCECN